MRTEHTYPLHTFIMFFFFFQAEDGIRDGHVTGVQTCALPIWPKRPINDQAPPMNDQMKIWMTTCSTYCRMPPIGTKGATTSASRTATAAARPIIARAGPGCRRAG